MRDRENGREPSLAALRIEETARNAAPRRRWTGWLVALAIIGAIVVTAAVLSRRPPLVEVATAAPAGERSVPALLNASGYVTPRRRATVAAKVTGRVLEVLVEEGDVVRAGQILARLDGADVRARLAAAEADRRTAEAALADLAVRLDNARREMRRAGDLEQQGVGSVQAADLARTEAASLEAQIELARARVRAAAAAAGVIRQELENYTVRAPFAGVVVSKDAQPGEMVSPVSAGGGFTRTGIATIVDMASLEIEVDVNEANIARVEAGQRVDATLDAYPAWHIPASVLTVIPTADRQKATVQVRIAFDALDPRILPDMGVKVAFLAGDDGGASAPTVRAVIPRDAVRKDGERDVVMVVDGGVVGRRAVRLGATRGTDVEVTAGVAAGERVVVDGPDGLRDGQRVRVAEAGHEGGS